MIDKYIEFNGKHPKAKKQNRCYTSKPDEQWVSYGCSYSDAFMKFDIDDYDHKSGELDEPIHGKPKSEAVLKLLDSLCDTSAGDPQNAQYEALVLRSATTTAPQLLQISSSAFSISSYSVSGSSAMPRS